MKYKIICFALSTLMLTTYMTSTTTIVKASIKHNYKTITANVNKAEITASEDALFSINNSTTGKDIKARIEGVDIKAKDIVVVDNQDGSYNVTIKNIHSYINPSQNNTTVIFYIIDKGTSILESSPSVEASLKVNKIKSDLSSLTQSSKELIYGTEVDKNIQINHPIAKSWIMRLPFRVLDKFPNVGDKVMDGYLKLSETYTPEVNADKSYQGWFELDRSKLNDFKIVKAKLSDLGFTTNNISNADMTIKLDNSTNIIDISRYLPSLKASQSYGNLQIKDLKANGISTTNLSSSGTIVRLSANDSTSSFPTITGTIVSDNIYDIPFTIKVNATRDEKIKPSVSVREVILYEGQTIKDVSIKYTAEDNNRNSVSGTLKFTEKENEELKQGSHKVRWEFTPDNSKKYEKVTGDATVTVKESKLEMIKEPVIDYNDLIINNSLNTVKFKDTGDFKLSSGSYISSRDLELKWKYPKDDIQFDEKAKILVKYKNKEYEFDINLFDRKNIRNFKINSNKGEMRVSLGTNDLSVKGRTLEINKPGTRIIFPNKNELIDSGALDIDVSGTVTLEDKATIKTNTGKLIHLNKGDKINPSDDLISMSNTVETTTETTSSETTSSGEDFSEIINYPFIDIQNSWAKDQIAFLANENIISGYNGEFNPKKPITRADFCIILKNYLDYIGADMAITKVDFKDIKGDEYYAQTVMSLAAADIINGYNDNTFKPHKNITREEATQLIANTLRATGSMLPEVDPIPTYRDENKISKWAKVAFEYANKKGIISGSNGLFRPQDLISREEVASIIYRIINAK